MTPRYAVLQEEKGQSSVGGAVGLAVDWVELLGQVFSEVN